MHDELHSLILLLVRFSSSFFLRLHYFYFYCHLSVCYIRNGPSVSVCYVIKMFTIRYAMHGRSHGRPSKTKFET